MTKSSNLEILKHSVELSLSLKDEEFKQNLENFLREIQGVLAKNCLKTADMRVHKKYYDIFWKLEYLIEEIQTSSLSEVFSAKASAGK